MLGGHQCGSMVLYIFLCLYENMHIFYLFLYIYIKNSFTLTFKECRVLRPLVLKLGTAVQIQ